MEKKKKVLIIADMEKQARSYLVHKGANPKVYKTGPFTVFEFLVTDYYIVLGNSWQGAIDQMKFDEVVAVCKYTDDTRRFLDRATGNKGPSKDKYPLPGMTIGVGATPRGCAHQWIRYSGIMDTYEYCTECDKKRRDHENA